MDHYVKRREIPAGLLASPLSHILATIMICGVLLFLGSFGIFASVVTALLSFGVFKFRFRGVGIHTPDPSVPFILLLHPFGSERRNFFILNWVSSAMWQFGQPVFPLDLASQSARTLGATPQPMWRRYRTGFFRVLDADYWAFEIPVLIDRASLIVIDTTLCRINLITELAAIEGRGKSRNAISIHEGGVDGQREKYSWTFSDNIRKIIDSSIQYNLDSPEDVRIFWEELVHRAATILHVPNEAVLYPQPPNIFSFNPRHLTYTLRRRSHDTIVGVKPDADVTASDEHP